MTISIRGGKSGLINDAAENVTATGVEFGSDVTAASVTLYSCSFSAAITVTCTTLSADYATFKALLAAGVTLSVTTFTPLFPRDLKTFGASVATSGQFLLVGGPSAASTATEGSGQVMMPSSYAVIAIVA